MGLRLPKLFGSSVKQASRVKATFKGQVVEAIRISYELARNPSTDHADICATLVALESVVEAAVNTEGQPEETTTDKLSVFVSCLKDDSMKERMAAAEGKDKRNVTQSAAQSLRLESVLEKVKKSPLLRSKHVFVIAEPRKDVTVEIAYDAKLPDILWKFHRTCDKDTVINPHFYPYPAFLEEIITQIPPLRDRNANKNSGKWTERIVVHGDDKEGRIRLTSEDETIARLFGAVTRSVVGPLTLFKDIDGHLSSEEEINQVFRSASNLKCFRSRGSSFEIDPDVKTVQDVIYYSGERLFVSSPLSMEPTDFRPPELRNSTSVMPATWPNGSSHVTQPFSAGRPFSFPVPVPQRPIGSRGISLLHARSRMVTRPLQQVSSDSPSIPIASHYTLPSHPPPTAPEPAKDQDSLPSAAPEKAAQVDPVEQTLLSIGDTGPPMNSRVITMETAESRRDGTVHHEQRGTPAIAIPQPTRQSRPPLLVPTQSSSQDGSIISSSPAPSSLGSSRVDTPISTGTSPSPAPFTNPRTNTYSSPEAPAASGNVPPSVSSAEGSYGTAIIQKPDPIQPRQPTPSQSPPSSIRSNSPSPPKGPGKPSTPPLQQAQGDNRSFWRRTVDGVAGWLGGSKK